MSKPQHHLRKQVCGTRAPYREGRKPKAVKVYTVNQESQYVLIQGVPTVGAGTELVRLFEAHGAIQEHRILDDYPAEQFTDVHLIKYEKIFSARMAKRKLDDWSFFGGVLHVCYAPEYETVAETREKLKDRRMAIAAKVRQYSKDGTYGSSVTDPSPANEMATNSSASTHTATKAPPPTTSGYTHYEENHAHHVISNQGQSNLRSYFPDNSFQSVQGVVCQHQLNTTNKSHFYGQNQHENVFKDAQRNIGINENPYTAVVSSDRQNIFQTNTQQQQNFHHTHNQESSQVGLRLPLPPRQVANRSHLNIHNRGGCRSLHNYEYAKVPTANAGFSPDFDARLKPDAAANEHISEELQQQDEELETQTLELEEYKPKSIHDKIEENIKKKSVVIKPFEKKGTTPMFIPRQALKNKTVQHIVKTNGEDGKSSSSNTDEVNARLKRNAFTLTEVQGPAQVPDRPETDPQEVSVQKSVKEIRKHLNQISTTEGPDTKKRKMSDT